MTMKKQTIIAALAAFIAQRSGIEFANYGERESFMADYRSILRDGREARRLLRAVEIRGGITAEHIIEASIRAFSGRLNITAKGDAVGIDYTPGQYFPTEYRAAACAVLAKCLWNHWQPDHATGNDIRKTARREFGRGIASRWFN